MKVTDVSHPAFTTFLWKDEISRCHFKLHEGRVYVFDPVVIVPPPGIPPLPPPAWQEVGGAIPVPLGELLRHFWRLLYGEGSSE
jgi:hypothetical protein